MLWSHELLLSKAKTYSTLAEKNFESHLRPLCSAIALEFLGRATLAKLSPALLADPRDGKNIMYSLGIKVEPPVKSVVAKTVFLRVKDIVASITTDDINFTTLMTEARNAELHSGSIGFEELPDDWEPQYYLILNKMLTHLSIPLEEFFPPETVDRIKLVIREFNQSVEKEVKSQITAAMIRFNKLDDNIREGLLRNQDEQVRQLRLKLKYTKAMSCPACKNSGFIWGEATEFSDSRLDGEEIVYDVKVVPHGFQCVVCGLAFTRYSQVASAGLGNTFIIHRTQDPIEFFNINPREHLTSDEIREIVSNYYDDYGND
nr:hypothetical protein [uncultured Bdellovibrio sp.]